jgi:hypothetical protein
VRFIAQYLFITNVKIDGDGAVVDADELGTGDGSNDTIINNLVVLGNIVGDNPTSLAGQWQRLHRYVYVSLNRKGAQSCRMNCTNNLISNRLCKPPI